MPLDLLTTYFQLPVFALVASRLGGMIMFQPVLGSMAVPMNLRVLLVAGLAAMLTPLVSLPPDAPTNLAALALAMGYEILLGGVIGLVAVACFLGLQWGGLVIAQECGLAFGRIVDPSSDEQETVLGVFYLQLAVVVFLIVGGHRALITSCLDTFEVIPLLTYDDALLRATDLLIDALTMGGHVALRVAAPVMIALFLVNLALGFVSRTMPQLNVIAIGFSLKAMVAFLMIMVTLPTATDVFVASLEEAYGWFHALIGTGG
jgi:flagellar biosynthetic protein FliR